MKSNAQTRTRTYDALIQQGRLWFRFARILEGKLAEKGSRLWVKPALHARYGLRQSTRLGARTFILTTRLEGGHEETLQEILHLECNGYEKLRTRRANAGLHLYRDDRHRLGALSRAAWSWIEPLAGIGYEPAFFLREIAVHEGVLKAHVVIAHFYLGVEIYLMRHYRERAEAALA